MISFKTLLVLILGMPLLVLLFRSNNLNYLLLQFFIFLIPLASLFFPPGNGLGITIFDCFLFAGFILSLKKIKKQKNNIYKYPMIFLFFSVLISTVFSNNISLALYGFILMLRFYIFYIIMINEVDNFNKVNRLVLLFSLSLIMISIMGFIQSIYNINFTLYANELNTNSEYKYSGIHSFVRVVGPFSNSLNFSNYLAVGIFLLMYFFNRDNKLKKILLILSLILVFSVLILTLSRGPVLVAIICFFIYLYFQLNKKMSFLVLGFLFSFLLIFPQFLSDIFILISNDDKLSRLLNVENLYNTGRYQLWANSLDSLSDHLFGVGLKNHDYLVTFPPSKFKYYILDYTPGWKPFNFHFESVYIAMFMNLGFLGFIGFVYLIYKLIITNYLIHVKSKITNHIRLSLSLLVASISFSVIMFANPALISDLRIMLLFWFILALTQINYNLYLDE